MRRSTKKKSIFKRLSKKIMSLNMKKSVEKRENPYRRDKLMKLKLL
jgi:hypothetical protein